MPNIDWNLKVWDKAYAWPKDGDEWSQQAEFCGVPYEEWKASLFRTFAIPHVNPSSTALEIGGGHGRWSVLLAPKVAELHVVDLSPSCIEFCRKRMAERTNVRYHVNDGKSLSMIRDGSVDFVWSFDTFVHIEEPEFRSYFGEIKRVMKRQAMGVIHHSGSPNAEQRQAGMRSLVEGRKAAGIVAENGLYMIRQISEWGRGCNMKLTGDVLTIFARP